ncbi:MAG TPA: hypothetical protein VMJ75_14440 [Candidatus Acidoferrales bacterium]|nr:hypothetical protein [Candidatus Acidoferrales bacterium]
MADLNAIYAATGVEFQFDPSRDFVAINRTLLNQTFTVLDDPSQYTDPNQEPPSSKDFNTAARTALANLYADKLVIYFSYGTEFDYSSGHWHVRGRTIDSSAWSAPYVSMRSFLPSAPGLGHEIGHYLQLEHPFAGDPQTIAEAGSMIKKYVEVDHHMRDEGLDVFDGDKLSVSDTPPDGRGKLLETANGGDKCGAVDHVPIPVTFGDGTVKQYTLKPDRTLVMSYFNDCPGLRALSPQQMTRVQRGLNSGIRHRLVSTKAADSQGQLERKGSKSTHGISALDVTMIEPGRVATAVVLSSGLLKIIVWDVAADGSTLTRRGDKDGDQAKRVKACALSLGYIATAALDESDVMQLTVWHVDANGDLTQQGRAAAGPVGTFDVCRISIDYQEYLVTAVSGGDSNLKVIVWRVTPDGQIKRLGDAQAGFVDRVSIHSMGVDSVATHVRESDGHLKVILWQITGSAVTRKGAAEGGSADDIVGCGMDLGVAATAVRLDSGNIKVIAWHSAAGDQVVDWRSDKAGDAVNQIAACRVGIDLLATASRNDQGNLSVSLWEIGAEGYGVIARDTDKAGAVSEVSICPAGRNVLITAMRNGSGDLELIAWKVN